MFVKDSINTFLLRCAVYGLAFWVSIIVSNLGQEVKGEVAIVFMMTDVVRLVSLMGFDAAAVYYLRRKKYDYDTVARTLNLVAPLMFLGWSLILFPLFYWLHSSGLFGNVDFKYIAACFVIAPFGSLMDIQINIFNGSGEIRRGNIVSFLFNVWYLLTLAVITFVFFEGTWGVLAAYAFAFVLSSLVGVAMNWKRSRSRRGFEWNPVLIKDLASWGIRSQAGALARKIASRTDLLLTNYFITVASAGVYAVALNWAELSLFIPFVLHYVLFPHVSGRERESSIRLTNRVARLSAAVLILIGASVCVIFPYMERILYKPDYSGAIYPIIIVMPGVISMGLFKIIMGGLDGLGRPQYGTYASFGALVSTVALNVLLIPRFGLIGAAAATSITGLVAFSIVGLYYRHLSSAKWSDFLFVKSEDIVAVYESVKSVVVGIRRKS